MFFPDGRYKDTDYRQMFYRGLFRRIFLDDWLLKIVALAITLALWLGVTGLRTPTTKRLKNVTLNLNFPNELEVINSPPADVELFVTGDKRKVEPLIGSDLVVSVDLSDIKAGNQVVQLTPENVSIQLPSGVKLDEITPNKIPIQLEKVIERAVPVRAETDGSVADGYEIYSETVIPVNARVRGAESAVKSLDSIMTEKINLENRNADFTARQVALNVSNSNITVLDGIVDVIFKVGEKRGERSFVISTNFENQSKRATVTLFGALSLLEKLNVETLSVTLIKSESGELVPHLILPPDLQDKLEVRKIKLS